MGDYTSRGWNNLWKLNAAPRAKFFMWLLLHGMAKTFAFLHALNIVYDDCCILYGKKLENIEQFFKQCSKSQMVWAKIEEVICNRINLGHKFMMEYSWRILIIGNLNGQPLS